MVFLSYIDNCLNSAFEGKKLNLIVSQLFLYHPGPLNCKLNIHVIGCKCDCIIKKTKISAYTFEATETIFLCMQQIKKLDRLI